MMADPGAELEFSHAHTVQRVHEEDRSSPVCTL